MEKPPPRPRGRPPLSQHDRTTSCSVSLPTRVHERLCQLAAHRGESLSATVRAVLLQRIDKRGE